MAKIHNNIFVRGLTGAIGDQFVIRQTRGGKTIIANKPQFDPDREFTDSQKTQQDAFREAASYARFAKNQPLYINKAKGTSATAYNIAVADWFGVPEVLEIDASQWTGEIGQTIRVKAQDNVEVASVRLKIDNGNGTTFEQGEATRGDGLWWTYTTQSQVTLTASPRIVATAQDMPGNSGDLTWQDN